MFTLCIVLSALSATFLPEDIDTIRSERLEEVVITSNSARQRIQNVQTGAEVLQIEDLTAAPQLFGENDIMRSIQLLPGVKSRPSTTMRWHLARSTRDCSRHNMGVPHRLYSTSQDVQATVTTIMVAPPSACSRQRAPSRGPS